MSNAASPSADGLEPDGFEPDVDADVAEEGFVAGSASRETLGDAALAALAAAAEPGPTMMAMLSGIDLAALPVVARLDVAAAWRRQAAWVAAKARVALAAVHDAPPEPEPAFAGRRGDAETAVLGEAQWRGAVARRRAGRAAALAAGHRRPQNVGGVPAGQPAAGHVRAATARRGRALGRRPRRGQRCPRNRS